MTVAGVLVRRLAYAIFGLGVVMFGQSAASPVDGIWLGTLQAGATALRVQLHLDKNGTACVFDSVDQKAFGIPCGNVVAKGEDVSFEVPAVQGKWVGKLSADGTTLTGDWSQGGGTLPLAMTKQSAAIERPKAEPPAFDAAMPPVPVAELKTVLDKDLAAVMATGALAPGTHGGVTIGVVQHGVRRIWSYGTAKDDSVYEIGSISKTFTATILATMVERKMITLDEPVRQLLPPGTVEKPASGAEIRLIDLSDQHSGLPRMPSNFAPKDPANPYADYDAALLYAYIGKQGVALPANAPFGYSNLGVGLLGQALANRAGKPWAELLAQDVTGPLGMKSTGVALTPSMQARFIQGYDGEGQPAHAWDLAALVGAGGIRSDADDMLTYLEAQLHPEKLADKTLGAAIAQTHVVRADVGGGQHIALNWFRVDETGSYWHNGGTGGFSSYASFNTEGDYGVVVLFNRTVGEGSVTDALGQHIAQRLRGVKAISLK